MSGAKAEPVAATSGTAASRSAPTSEADRLIVIERLIRAPRERVFDAWVDRDAIGKWFGPNGFTITTSEMDVRVGGTWRFVMHGGDGTDYVNWVRYEEIVRPERLVYAHGGAREEPEFHATVTFTERDGGTLVTLRTLFPTKEARDLKVRKVNAIEGGKQTLGRLAAFVEAA